VVAALRDLNRATAREILNVLRREGTDVAYTTVNTILARLTRKGVVQRSSEAYKGAERYVYLYKDIEGEYIDGLLQGLTRAFGKRGVVHLAERIEGLSDEQVRDLARRLKA